MGKTVTPLILTNFIDLANERSGLARPGRVRRVEVDIGQIPPEHLELVVKPATREVVVNPDHPDGPISEMFRLSA